jgi:thymidylate synthase
MNNADKQYQALLTNIIENGRQKGDRTGTGTISIPFGTLDFDMNEGFPLLTTKKIFTKAVIHELLWFLNGDTNIQYLEQNGVSIWTSDAYREYVKKVGHNPNDVLTKENFADAIRKNDVFAKKFGELGPVYGHQWRHWNYLMWSKPDAAEVSKGNNVYNWSLKGIDQIQQAMDKLINNPDDRRIMVSAWNVDEIDHMALPPCHYGFQLYTEELTLNERIGLLLKTVTDTSSMNHMTDEERDKYLTLINIPKRKLSLIWDQRSCDTFLGIPFNIASYGILLHMFAQQANMVPDRLIGSLKNVHIYNNHIEQCKEQISREPLQLPTIELNKAKDIFSYTFDDIKFINYTPHDKIAGAISV